MGAWWGNGEDGCEQKKDGPGQLSLGPSGAGKCVVGD